MKIVLGLLSGVLGMLAGWFGLAFLVMALAGPDRDGGIAMGAFFNIGPLGALIGFGVGIWVFARMGLVGQSAVSKAEAPAAPTVSRISRPFAVIVLAILGGLAWWGWFELIRSPYLTNGFMTLAVQFRLPADMTPPAEAKDITIFLDEAGKRWPAIVSERAWRGHQGDRVVILASVSMMYKTGQRTITLSIPGAPSQSWTLDLPSDPDPMPEFTTWRPSTGAPGAIELNYRLTADN